MVMENAEVNDVLANPSARYTTSLLRRSGLATESYAITHPSLPNYLALTSGSTHGVRSDCVNCHVDARNIVDQLEAKRISWKAYLEDVPGACFRGSAAAGYAKKHNPFIYYDDIALSPRRCGRQESWRCAVWRAGRSTALPADSGIRRRGFSGSNVPANPERC